MRVLFYAPLKPLNHPHPSGDLVTATGLTDFLSCRGHVVSEASRLRARWIYAKPWLWLALIRDIRRTIRLAFQKKPDIFLTYHSYYKSPDLIGPYITKKLNIPYVIFQGIYSTKKRRKVTTWPGFMLNRYALSKAEYVFSNRSVDMINLKRLIPENRLSYIRPGIQPDDFQFDPEARTELRQEWKVGDVPVIVTAAMFRPGVKADGLEWVIRCCARLQQDGFRHQLVIVGDGIERSRLRRLAHELIPNAAIFVGQTDRNRMYRFYSAGDVFVFPGIRETLGMVYLEAQSCGLPVVAFDNGGIPEVVQHEKTGFLTAAFDIPAFDRAVKIILTNSKLRLNMGHKAKQYIQLYHDINRNLLYFEDKLINFIKSW
ncbi:MAG: glycosyltransferase family 4 protein [Desulfatirhabdiaceae bacterium]